MTDVIKEIFSIETEAQRIEEEYEQKILQSKEQVEVEKNNITEVKDAEFEKYQQRIDDQFTTKLNSFKEMVDQETINEQNKLQETFKQHKDDVIEQAIKKVVNEYGNS